MTTEEALEAMVNAVCESRGLKREEVSASFNLSGELRSPIGSVAPLDMFIAVGFGEAQILKNGEIVFDENNFDDYHQLSEFEEMAKLEPDAEWICLLNAPCYSSKWQRQSEGIWVCIETGTGFA